MVLLCLLSQEVSTGNGTVVNLLPGCSWVMVRARFVDVMLKHYRSHRLADNNVGLAEGFVSSLLF